ncbi:head decoration protein [Pseudomonas panipatensis]|uniref:Bacteriophage lambda head decoration protein D n=1 Tax=Pseudomonas panipatensis TaxID=428992 RepID=A0A1G8CVS8_9PSED|nr:head decoration protein [Pseudomonas panipatensis]SDH49414.1 Bacteriophage lambda head decoration protein D [Pseudomonas panipatensis]SMP63352.1 Bacteriophage lambda head decoration protein D [Pseudomonas panipatensis]
MTIKTEGIHPGEFLLSEANGTRSREVVVITAGSGLLRAGTLISQLTAANALTPTAKAGNTGNGTIGSVVVTSAAASGPHVLTIVEAAANGGVFEVYDPSGQFVGEGHVGQAFIGGGLTFTLGDGSTDFVVGDGFTLAVKASLGEWTAYDDDGTDDGRRTADGILYASVDASVVDVEATAVLRDAEVIERLLTGLDVNGAADLAGLGIVIRP